VTTDRFYYILEVQMAGTMKVEVQGKDAQEIKKHLEDIIKEIDKANLQPGQKKVDMGTTAAWKVTYET
jgi:hypothetical protein